MDMFAKNVQVRQVTWASTSVRGKVKLDVGGLGNAPKIQVVKPEDFADFEKVYKDCEQKYGGFGIIGVKPPRGMAPPPMNFPRDGVNAWGNFADIKCIDEMSEQISWRIDKEPEEGELMGQTEAIAVLFNGDAAASTPAEFTRRAKKDGFYEPFSRNIDECCELFWSWMQNIGHTSYDAAKKGQPPNTPRYATSIDGSFVKILARQAKGSWDTSNLPVDIFKRICLEQDPTAIIRGVHTPECFIGMRGTFFTGHFEDIFLNSMNYHLGGYPKVWYSIPLYYIAKFRNEVDQYMRDVGEHDGTCNGFIAHKRFLFHPEWFKLRDIPLVRLVQQPGEYVLTFPYGYHFGFNTGFTVNEAVNFATESWIDAGKVAVKCTCKADKRYGFTQSMVPFVEKFQPTRFKNWLKGEDAMCPMSVHLGGEPVVPAAPSFEDLVKYKGDSPLVEDMKQKWDRTGRKEEKLKKAWARNKEKLKKREEKERRRPTTSASVITTGRENNHALYCTDNDIIYTASQENLERYKQLLEDIRRNLNTVNPVAAKALNKHELMFISSDSSDDDF